MEELEGPMPEGLEHISDWFWRIIQRADKSREELREILMGMSWVAAEVYRERFGETIGVYG